MSKATSFDKNTYESNDLYRWSSLRSAYVAEANADAAPSYIYAGSDWYGAGWYWDPSFSAYTFIPGDGIFYSPFGWGFYSPFYAGWGPFGLATDSGTATDCRALHHHFDHDYHAWGPGPHYNPGMRGGGFRRATAHRVFAVVRASEREASAEDSMVAQRRIPRRWWRRSRRAKEIRLQQ